MDELIWVATDGGIDLRKCEIITHTAAGPTSVNIRGKTFVKLRKVLGKIQQHSLERNSHIGALRSCC